MRINLISATERQQLEDIFHNYPNLTLQNPRSAYSYIKEDKLTDTDKAKRLEVTEILKRAVFGFSSFSNFPLSKDGLIQIRLQYDWVEPNENGERLTRLTSFIGVGYILLDELAYGFETETV